MHFSSRTKGWANRPLVSRAALYACAQEPSPCCASLAKSDGILRGQLAFWPDLLPRQLPTLRGGAFARHALCSTTNNSGGVTPAVRPGGVFSGLPFRQA